MEFSLSKIILIVILAGIIGGIIGATIAVLVTSSRTKPSPPSPPVSLGATTTMSQFLTGLYDKKEKGFRLDQFAPVSLEATYYALLSAKNSRTSLPEEIKIEEIFNKIRSYYDSSLGYYLGENKDPLSSTKMALELDSHYPQNLDQSINLEWLKMNSLENKELEEEKFDPQYQKTVLDIYQFLGGKIDQKEIKRRITPLYVEYYCNYQISQASQEDFLRKKYYQVAIVSSLTGAQKVSESCFKREKVEEDLRRLEKISLQDLNDIKEVFWLFSLKRFFELRVDLKEVMRKIEKFYTTGGGFREKLSDQIPNLVGTFYGSSLSQLLYSQ